MKFLLNTIFAIHVLGTYTGEWVSLVLMHLACFRDLKVVSMLCLNLWVASLIVKRMFAFFCGNILLPKPSSIMSLRIQFVLVLWKHFMGRAISWTLLVCSQSLKSQIICRKSDEVLVGLLSIKLHVGRVSKHRIWPEINKCLWESNLFLFCWNITTQCYQMLVWFKFWT